MVGTRRTPEPPAAGRRHAAAKEVRLSQIGARYCGSEVAHLLRHDGEGQTVFGVVHEFPHPLLSEAVAQSMRPAALAERLHAGPGRTTR